MNKNQIANILLLQLDPVMQVTNAQIKEVGGKIPMLATTS